MARSRTLAELREDVADRADVKVEDEARFETSRIDRYINQAIQRFRGICADLGHELYLKRATVTTSADSTVGADGLAPRDYITLPDDLYHLKGIDLALSGNRSLTMMPFERVERNMFRDYPGWFAWWNRGGVGVPVFYRLGGTATITTPGTPTEEDPTPEDIVETFQIAQLIPSSNGEREATIIYVPTATDLEEDEDTFDGIAGYEEYIINRAALDCRIKDGLADPVYGALQTELRRCEMDLRSGVANRNPPGKRVDTRGMVEQLLAISRGRWV